MAADGVDVKIRGIRELDAGLARLARNIETSVPRDAVQPVAEQTATTIGGRVPHRTGRLAGSVGVARRGDVSQVQMGAGLAYARWIEFGAYRGRKPGGGRYVYPTAKRTQRAFAKHCERVVAQQIGRMHWSRPS
jgi:Bacteriophage HK97-gp10, putative tail-component